MPLIINLPHIYHTQHKSLTIPAPWYLHLHMPSFCFYMHMLWTDIFNPTTVYWCLIMGGFTTTNPPMDKFYQIRLRSAVYLEMKKGELQCREGFFPLHNIYHRNISTFFLKRSKSYLCAGRNHALDDISKMLSPVAYRRMQEKLPWKRTIKIIPYYLAILVEWALASRFCLWKRKIFPAHAYIYIHND